jgi:hypothetical protein
MRRISFAATCLPSLFSILVFSAAAQQVAINKDTQAMTIAATAMSAMGTATALALNDSQTSANVYPAFADATGVPVSIETSGTKKKRATTKMAKGLMVRIVNSGVGQLIQPDGTVSPLSLDITLAERVDHIPALSLLAEANDPAVDVLYVGKDSLNGVACDVISLSLPLLGQPSDADAFRESTKTSVWVDQNTGLALKISYTQRQSQPAPGSFQIDQFYSNYQSVQGVAVPFTQTTFVDGQLTSTLSIQSVQFNTGVPDTDFAVQGVN